MAKKPTHVPSSRKQHEIVLRALVCGGFVIENGRRRDCDLHFPDQAAGFTTLDEALAWLRVNMEQPATSSKPGEPA